MPEKTLAVSPTAKRHSRPKWDKAEKRFIVASLLLIGCFCSSLVWWGRLNELPEYQIPNPALPSPNAFDTYLQATWTMAPVKKPAVDPIVDTESLTDPKERAQRYSLARRDAWLKQNAGAFALLRQGLKQQYQQPSARSWSALFPYLSGFRELARRLMVESKTHLLRGKAGAAASSALDTMQFGTQVPRGGPLISGLVGIAIQNMGRLQLSKVLPHLSAAQCKSAIQRLEKIRAVQLPYAQMVREEKWCGQSGMLEIMKKPDWAGQFATNLVGLTGTPTYLWDKWRFMLVGKRRALDNYTNFMDKSIIEATKPYAKMQDVPVPDDRINQILAPTFGRTRFTFARAEAGADLLAVALALRAYKLERGAYPTKLAALVPTYLRKIPADAFGGGEPLRYQKQGPTYKLWSLGPDLKDNGGQPIKNMTVNRYDETEKDAPRDETTQGDWVMQP